MVRRGHSVVHRIEKWFVAVIQSSVALEYNSLEYTKAQIEF